MSDVRPNIVLIVTDQQQARAIGAVDSSFRTPNVDRLVDEGVQFTGCHATCPQCSPSRSSLLTGTYPHQNGMYALPEWGPGPLDPDYPTIGRTLRGEGYNTAYVGKWHLGETDLEAYGWQDWCNVHETSNPPEGFETDRVTRERTVEYLDSYEESDPFLLVSCFNLPHPPFLEDEEFAGWFDCSSVPLPRSFDDDLRNKPAFQRERATDEEGNLDESDAREIRYRYRTMVARVDDHVGQILDAVERRRSDRDTVVVFTSDHGDMQGAHRLNKKGVIAYDEILRVPLVVNVPNRNSKRDVIPDLVSLRSIPSTLADAAGFGDDAPFEGESLLAHFDRESPPEGERIFFEHKYAYWGEHPYRGVRTRRWKFVEYLTDDEAELYDMRADPTETTNLVGRPEYDSEEKRLRTMVDRWWDETGGDEEQWTRPLER